MPSKHKRCKQMVQWKKKKHMSMNTYGNAAINLCCAFVFVFNDLSQA